MIKLVNHNICNFSLRNLKKNEQSQATEAVAVFQDSLEDQTTEAISTEDDLSVEEGPQCPVPDPPNLAICNNSNNACVSNACAITDSDEYNTDSCKKKNKIKKKKYITKKHKSAEMGRSKNKHVDEKQASIGFFFPSTTNKEKTTLGEQICDQKCNEVEVSLPDNELKEGRRSSQREKLSLNYSEMLHGTNDLLLKAGIRKLDTTAQDGKDKIKGDPNSDGKKIITSNDNHLEKGSKLQASSGCVQFIAEESAFQNNEIMSNNKKKEVPSSKNESLASNAELSANDAVPARATFATNETSDSQPRRNLRRRVFLARYLSAPEDAVRSPDGEIVSTSPKLRRCTQRRHLTNRPVRGQLRKQRGNHQQGGGLALEEDLPTKNWKPTINGIVSLDAQVEERVAPNIISKLDKNEQSSVNSNGKQGCSLIIIFLMFNICFLLSISTFIE